MVEQLESWKEIAAYLGREVRTVQRWAATRGLPVRRLPGGKRPRVFSFTREIDEWLRAGSADARLAHTPDSIAVLPFLNLTGDAAETSFGRGLAEDVITALVRVPGLRVTARTSSFMFAGRARDVRQIAVRLGVAWVLEGSIRRDGERLRVSAQLIDAVDGCHVWSERYDRHLTDIFEIQDEIARSIALALKQTLARPAALVNPTKDLVAYELWTTGRSTSQDYTPDAYLRSRECYEAAIARDPGFARAHFALAELLFYGVEFGLSRSPADAPKAREALARALECDEMLGEAHALLGVFQGLLEYDWPAAEQSFARAFALSPGSSTMLSQHAWYHLVPKLRLEEAVREAQQAASLDPLSPFVRGSLGLTFLAARQYARAVDECRLAVELAPRLWWLRWFYGTALLLHGRRERGFRECQLVFDRNPQPAVAGAMAMLCGMFGRRNRARRLLTKLQEAAAQRSYVPPLAFAWAYIGLGDDRAFEWLDKAVEARNPVVTHLPSMPLYDRIRRDPRFQGLLAKMHLA
jgi:TolB-like protein